MIRLLIICQLSSLIFGQKLFEEFEKGRNNNYHSKETFRFDTVPDDGSYTILLESVEGGEMIGRYSFLGSQPFMVLKSKGNRVTLEKNGETTERILRSGEDALDVLKELLASYSFVPIPGLPRFCGGAVGYLSYDMVRHFEKLPVLTDDDLELPDSCFLFADSFLIISPVELRFFAMPR